MPIFTKYPYSKNSPVPAEKDRGSSPDALRFAALCLTMYSSPFILHSSPFTLSLFT
jgi:hypothetical protein